MRDFIVEVAEDAGRYLLDNFRKDKSLIFERRIAKDLSTKYDKKSDEIIIKLISEEYPDHNILAEESGSIDNNSDYTWVVDSLDGTTNFASGNPFFSVSIALLKKEEVQLGAIFAPFLNELYFAENGKGAFLNGEKIGVSDASEIEKSYFLSCEGGEKTNERCADINHIFHPRVKDLRKLGSAAIETGWVACGRADVYLTTMINEWDVAAGVLLVEEAGGKVTDFKGDPWEVKKGDALFSNGTLHGKVLELIK